MQKATAGAGGRSRSILSRRGRARGVLGAGLGAGGVGAQEWEQRSGSIGEGAEGWEDTGHGRSHHQ